MRSRGGYVADSRPAHDDRLPARWLVEHERLLPHAGRALDVACGRGRHAFWLAARGLDTVAMDRSREAVAFVNGEARRQALPLRATVVDLEAEDVSLESAAYDIVVVVHYLHRPLFPALRAAVRRGGVLVYETFISAQARRGKPTNPAFLLDPGELRELVSPLEVLVEREGEFEEKMLASVIARRP
jgi:SAM-dependent methyltransferase